LLNHPFHTILQAIAALGRRGLDLPHSITDGCEVELFDNLVLGRGVDKILLVGEDKKRDILQLVFVQKAIQFIASFFHAP